jgi:hypothetical protein
MMKPRLPAIVIIGIICLLLGAANLSTFFVIHWSFVQIGIFFGVLLLIALSLLVFLRK